MPQYWASERWSERGGEMRIAGIAGILLALSTLL